MSAFIVGKPHIDHLVRVAVDGPAGHHPNWRTYWFTGERMQDAGDDPDAAGRVLWCENLRSVAHRYPDSAGQDYPGPAALTIAEVETYRYQRPRARLTAVAAPKTLDCFEYQSCEHPGWPTSSAFAFCHALRKRLIATLPGYDDAPWEIVE